MNKEDIIEVIKDAAFFGGTINDEDVEECKEFLDKLGLTIPVIMHRLLTELGFTKCENDKYRRCMIHDSMHIKLDEWGYMYVFAELDMKDIKIPITCIEPKDKDKFKDWLLFTYGA